MELVKSVFAGVGAFAICYALTKTFLKWRSGKNAAREGSETSKKKIKTMDIYLIVIAVALFAFTLKMISLFETYMAVPDTLITCVFAACGGECGVLGWIKTTKDKQQDRKWILEDIERQKKESERFIENQNQI